MSHDSNRQDTMDARKRRCKQSGEKRALILWEKRGLGAQVTVNWDLLLLFVCAEKETNGRLPTVSQFAGSYWYDGTCLKLHGAANHACDATFLLPCKTKVSIHGREHVVALLLTPPFLAVSTGYKLKTPSSELHGEAESIRDSLAQSIVP